MSFSQTRALLFQIHMWIGLVLGILLALLGLSGSVLVYDDLIASLSNPIPHAVTTQGRDLPLARIVEIARNAAGATHGQVAVTPPQEPGAAAQVRFGQMSRMGDSPRGAIDVFLDPVSGAVLANRTASQPAFLSFAHQLHGNFLMGRGGRRFVGWLGLAMLALGATGLVLWWPRRGQWKYAFIVRRTAKGLRFHRELHAMLGIWAFLVFMVVSFSGVVLAWPQAFGASQSDPAPRAMPAMAPMDNARRIDATQAAAIAQAALPRAALRSVMLPALPGQAIAVSFLAHGAINAQVLIDPYSGAVIAKRDPSQSVLAWQRPVHQGSLGPVWKFLVFLTGLLPAVFVITGIVMWWKKRRSHLAMNAPLGNAA